MLTSGINIPRNWMKEKIHVIQLGSIHSWNYGKEQIQLVETFDLERILHMTKECYNEQQP